jgi:hypothetical protein
MRHLDTWVDIDASQARVWQALSDVTSYPRWNPFIVQAHGEVCTGATLAITMHLPAKGLQRYQVRVTNLQAPSLFAWLGHFHVRGLIDGDHCFELTPRSGGGVRLHHHESFRGLMVPLVWRGFIQRHLLPSFEALNQNLKAHCEGRPLPWPVQPVK